jgi:hypothetical protein
MRNDRAAGKRCVYATTENQGFWFGPRFDGRSRSATANYDKCHGASAGGDSCRDVHVKYGQLPSNRGRATSPLTSSCPTNRSASMSASGWLKGTALSCTLKTVERYTLLQHATRRNVRAVS